MNYRKIFLYIIYIILSLTVIYINAYFVVEWLNRSLFTDFTINIDRIGESFSNGMSIIIVLSLLIFSLVGSVITSVLIVNVISALLVVANHLKVQERNDLLTFSELKTISSPKDVIALVEVSMGIVLTAFIILTVVLILLHIIISKLGKRLGVRFNYKFRLVILVCSSAFLMGVYTFPNEFNERVMLYPKSESHNFNPLKRAQEDGFIPTLLSTIKPDYMEKPTKYEKKKVVEIKSKYEEKAEMINENRLQYFNDAVTILYLSESLINPDKWPLFLDNEETLPYINSLLDQQYSGTMYSQFVGGGTANIEWSVLTSFSLEAFYSPISTTPYSDFYVDSPSHSTVLQSTDKEAIAIHPYTAHLYKRRAIYSKIGIDEFKFLDNGIKYTEKIGNHHRVSDASLNKEIFDELEKDTTGIMHVLSMQNHSPYDRDIPDSDFHPNIDKEFFSEGKETELINYLQGLRETDNVMVELIDYINNSDKDINLLFYGDHFPNVFNGISEKFGEFGRHETPWFIYLNNDRNQIQKKKELLSPLFLTTAMLEAGNYKVSPFQGLLTTLYEQQVSRIGMDYIYKNEEKIMDEDLPKETLELIQDYRIIMFDALFGKNYLDEDFYTMPKSNQ